MTGSTPIAERDRLRQDANREQNWKRWGPYLAERQWGTVREDYSADGSCWDYFPHDHARSRAYRWGEDGLLGISDRQGRLCLALALWNGRDPILKERLFGLTGSQGNHGEDVKEQYFYLDSTPTHSFMRGLYKYPQTEYPYARLLQESQRRGYGDPEFELADSGAFGEDRYFDVFAEYGKSTAEDLLVRITIHNRGPDAAELHVLPTLWFRNTWSWGRTGEGYWPKPAITQGGDRTLHAEQDSLGAYALELDELQDGTLAGVLFTDNETNVQRLYGLANPQPYVKDAFHDYVVYGNHAAVNPAARGTKAAFHCAFVVPAGGQVSLRLRLRAVAAATVPAFGRGFEQTLALRQQEAEQFFATLMPAALTDEERRVQRQAYAGLLWSKQFFHFDVATWLEGDPSQPKPPVQRLSGRNKDWRHLYNRDVLSMPDKWEYPWYA
ncbi:MAG TPA: glucosidase, partial [Planctomycetota bacterium]|nr:glucosidase [Planctomycetota bacterium]